MNHGQCYGHDRSSFSAILIEINQVADLTIHEGNVKQLFLLVLQAFGFIIGL